MDTLAEMIDAVKQYSKDNWGKEGWDFVYECWETDDIVDVIRSCKSCEDAVREVGKVAKLLDEQRMEARAW